MLIIINLFAGAQLWAANLEDHYLKSLARARSGVEVEQLSAEYSRLKVAQTACRIQLHEQNVPVSCYEAVELESKLDRGADKGAQNRRIQHLDRLCSSAAANLRFNNETAAVSSACAKNIVSARAIQNYREEENADWSKY
ncbi:MAG: hypothetical protein ACXVA9_06390 [Bdellovibrionales bacterium]